MGDTNFAETAAAFGAEGGNRLSDSSQVMPGRDSGKEVRSVWVALTKDHEQVCLRNGRPLIVCGRRRIEDLREDSEKLSRALGLDVHIVEFRYHDVADKINASKAKKKTRG